MGQGNQELSIVILCLGSIMQLAGKEIRLEGN